MVYVQKVLHKVLFLFYGHYCFFLCAEQRRKKQVRFSSQDSKNLSPLSKRHQKTSLTTHLLQIFLFQLTTDFFGCWDFFVLINSSQGHDEGTSRSNPCSLPQVDQCCRSRALPSKGGNVWLFSNIFFFVTRSCIACMGGP